MFDIAVPLMHLAIVGIPTVALAIDNYYQR